MFEHNRSLAEKMEKPVSVRGKVSGRKRSLTTEL